jgi:hypothetical protein
LQDADNPGPNEVHLLSVEGINENGMCPSYATHVDSYGATTAPHTTFPLPASMQATLLEEENDGTLLEDDNLPISNQLLPIPFWEAASATSWPFANPEGDCVDLSLCDLFGPEDNCVISTAPALQRLHLDMDALPCNQSVFGPLDDLQYAASASDGPTGLLQTPYDHDGETSNKSPAKQKAPAKKVTAVKRTANKQAAKKPHASRALASGVVQAPGAFPKRAKGGGNMSVRAVKKSNRTFEVKMNKDCIALWKPKDSYVVQITTFKDFIDDLPSTAKTQDKIWHPLLHVSSVCIPLCLSDNIKNRMYGHRKPGNKAFAQLMTYLGLRSKINKKTQVRTLTFDPEGWNRMGYRLIKGGDTRGGKPEIVFVR